MIILTRIFTNIIYNLKSEYITKYEVINNHFFVLELMYLFYVLTFELRTIALSKTNNCHCSLNENNYQ